MPLPKSASAFPDARAFLNNANKEEKGLRVLFESQKAAIHFRFRCYTVRARELSRNKKVYTEVDKEFAQTVWDSISLRLEPVSDGTCWLIARHDEELVGVLEVESIK